MKINFINDRMQIICEDARDVAFLEHGLKTRETGKVFAKLSIFQGKYEDLPMIEIFPYLDKEQRDEKRSKRDAAYDWRMEDERI